MDATLEDAATKAISFGQMEEEAPALARQVRERFEATGLCLVSTIRSDGWPRLSPLEPLILDGQLYLGMMPRSTKSRDLTRDPRCLVHSTIADKDDTEGEVKLYGLGRRIRDAAEIERFCVALEEVIGWRPDGPDDFDLWALDLTQGAQQRFDAAAGTQTTEVWYPGRPIRSSTKKVA